MRERIEKSCGSEREERGRDGKGEWNRENGRVDRETTDEKRDRERDRQRKRDGVVFVSGD